MVSRWTLEFASDLRYARHRSRCRSGLATGESAQGNQGRKRFQGGWERGAHQATYCARPGMRTGTRVVSDESERRLSYKSVWRGDLSWLFESDPTMLRRNGSQPTGGTQSYVPRPDAQ